jgi:hypothetical protein
LGCPVAVINEERYRVLVETANDAIVSMNESGAILFANPDQQLRPSWRRVTRMLIREWISREKGRTKVREATY